MPQLSLHTPFDDITLSEEDGFIVSLDWGWSPFQEKTPLLERAAAQLHDYFDGHLTRFDLPLAPSGTKFQQAVWDELIAIPYGQTLNYGDIAKKLHSHARAVGQACGLNPIPIIIPCHRVLGANGKLCGYSGDGGIDTKRQLLNLEGAAQFALI
jgi:methylated-DNA-[protein]-cysteine S-methyltransferase